MATPFTADQPFKENNVINESERSVDPTDDVGRLVQLEADGAISQVFVTGGYGDGSDGDVDLDGTNTYSSAMSKSGNTYTLLRDLRASDLIIGEGVTLVTDGYKVYVKNEISGSGTVTWGTPNNGQDGSNTEHFEAAGGAQSGSGILKNIAGANGGKNGSNDGTTGGIAGNPAEAAMEGIDSTECIGVAGSDGGNGGGTTGNGEHYTLGGTGGVISTPNIDFGTTRFLTALMVDLKTDYTLAQILPSAGAGGGGEGGDGSTSGVAGSGGAGGASGGTVYIAARVWSGTFTIKSNGGNGGNGGNGDTECGGGGGGAGGAGGVAVTIYTIKNWTGSYDLAGGTGGTAGTNGSAGVAAQNGDDGLAGNSYEVNLFSLM